MKRGLTIIAASVALLLFACQSSKSSKDITFKVWGNCDMCKETIETALKINGIVKADWNVDSKLIAITYDTLLIMPKQIHEKIAAVGYDTELLIGDSVAYNNLHACCQYVRKASN